MGITGSTGGEYGVEETVASHDGAESQAVVEAAETLVIILKKKR